MQANEESSTAPLSAKDHIPVLDGIRAVAVLLVIGFHFWQGFSHGASLIGKMAYWGQTGVDLFFVLSGFLITGILLDSQGSEHYLRNFYVRRMLRIFPLYYATLLAVYLVGPLLHLNEWVPWQKSVWYWVYFQNLPQTFAPALALGPRHFWSLAVEEHYYLVWPFLVLLLTRAKLLKVIVLAIAVSLLTRALLTQYATFYFTLARLDGLAIGSAVAIFARNQDVGLASLVPSAKRVLYFLAPALIAAQMLTHGRGVALIQILKGTLIAFIYASLIILAVEDRLGPTVARLLSSRVLGSVGKYSYGMYVLHLFILSGLRQAGLPYSVFGLLVSVSLTYLAAWVSWTIFEKHFLRLKRHFAYSQKRQAHAVSSPVAMPL